MKTDAQLLEKYGVEKIRRAIDFFEQDREAAENVA